MLNVIFAIVGLLLAILINVLADDLPLRIRPLPPHCPKCATIHKPTHWLGLLRRRCPECGLATRRRVLAVEVVTLILFGLLPTLIPDLTNLIVNMSLLKYRFIQAHTPMKFLGLF